MNSFASYKDQCYNPGSPSPNPISSPLNYLPATYSDFSFSPPKQTASTSEGARKNLKRKFDFDGSPESPSKKQKMVTKEEMVELLKANNVQMETALMNKIDVKLDEKMNEGFQLLKDSLTKLENKVDEKRWKKKGE